MKRHDENKDLRSFSRIGKVNYGDKTLQANRTTTIGIRLWGKIDYLTHYCGWHFLWNNSIDVGVVNSNPNDDSSSKPSKKAAKEHKLTDKTKRKK